MLSSQRAPQQMAAARIGQTPGGPPAPPPRPSSTNVSRSNTMERNISGKCDPASKNACSVFGGVANMWADGWTDGRTNIKKMRFLLTYIEKKNVKKHKNSCGVSIKQNRK